MANTNKESSGSPRIHLEFQFSSLRELLGSQEPEVETFLKNRLGQLEFEALKRLDHLLMEWLQLDPLNAEKLMNDPFGTMRSLGIEIDPKLLQVGVSLLGSMKIELLRELTARNGSLISSVRASMRK